MEVERYAALLVRRWWIVAIVVVLAVASAYGVSKATKPMFRAEAVLNAGASLGGNGNASEYISLAQGGLLNQYASILKSRTLAQETSDALKLDMPVEKLQGEVKAVPVTQDLTITLDVEDADPHRARDIANTLATLFVKQKQDEASKAAAVLGGQQDTVLVTIQDKAFTPPAPFKPRTRINMLAGAILGGIIGVLIVFGLDWLDDTLRGPGEAESLLDTRILAAIPQLKARRGLGASRAEPSHPSGRG